MEATVKKLYIVVLASFLFSCSVRNLEIEKGFLGYAVEKTNEKIRIHSLKRKNDKSLIEISDEFLKEFGKLGVLRFQNLEFSIFSKQSIPNIFLETPRFHFKTYKSTFDVFFIDQSNFKYVSDFNDVIRLAFELPKDYDASHILRAFRIAAHESYHVAEITENLDGFESKSIESEYLASLYAFCFTSTFLVDHETKFLSNDFNKSDTHKSKNPLFKESIQGKILFENEIVRRINNNLFDTTNDKHIEAIKSLCQEAFK